MCYLQTAQMLLGDRAAVTWRPCSCYLETVQMLLTVRDRTAAKLLYELISFFKVHLTVMYDSFKVRSIVELERYYPLNLAILAFSLKSSLYISTDEEFELCYLLI